MTVISSHSGRASLPYFVTGGTLPRDAPCYVRRKADEDLFTALQQSEFCYVLTARQMGKSSLMVHTATRLRQHGVTVALLDLTAIGQNLSPVQWYRGLLGRLGRQLDVEDDLDESWEAAAGLGGMQRWVETLGDVLLKQFSGPIVLFVDEIDAVRSLPFSADEFFAAIRECYNRRADNPDYKRLTFCLLGVATPAELVRDTRNTPFNIGHRIELNDFTRKEVMLLAPGFTDQGNSPATARRLLERIHFWTDGHPYLTQRLCRAAVEAGTTQVQQIDRLCEDLFFGPTLHNRDDNLLFVQDRLLRASSDVAATLDLYQKVLSGKRCIEGRCGDSGELLRLSGIVSVDPNSLIKPRNRIYRHVFNRQWVQDNMPHQELRRQRAAFWKGLMRAGTVSIVITSTLVSLAWLALMREREARLLLYVSDMNLAQEALAQHNIARARELLLNHRNDPFRSWDYRFLQRQCWRNAPSLSIPKPADPTAGGSVAAIQGIAISPNGKYLAGASLDGGVALWDAATSQRIQLEKGEQFRASDVALTDKGSLLAAAGDEGTVAVWSTRTGTRLRILPTGQVYLGTVAFSPDGNYLAVAGDGGLLLVWETASWRIVYRTANAAYRINDLAFSRDNHLAAANTDGAIVIRDSHFRNPRTLRGLGSDSVTGIAFAPGGDRIASVTQDGNLRIWDCKTGNLTWNNTNIGSNLNAVAYSPDGRSLALAGADGSVTVHSIHPYIPLAVFDGHLKDVRGIAFTPDGARILSGSRDGKVFSWDWEMERRNVRQLKRPDASFFRAAFSPDGTLVATAEAGEQGQVELWDTVTGRRLRVFVGGSGPVSALAFRGDGQSVLIGRSGSDRVENYDITTGRLSHTIPSAPVGILTALAASGGGDEIAVASMDPLRVAFSAAGEGTRIVPLPQGNAAMVSALAFSPQGNWLALGFNDAQLAVWNCRESKRENRTPEILTGHGSYITNVAFTPNDSILSSSSQDGSVKIWNMPARREVLTLKGHGSDVIALVFRPDGATLQTISRDGMIRIWQGSTL